MDDKLLKRLYKIDDHILILREAERHFLMLSAHEKVLYARMYTALVGGSVEDRKQRVYASEDWERFSKGLVAAEVDYLEQRRLYELKLKAYDAEHLTLKTETPAIRRQQ